MPPIVEPLSSNRVYLGHCDCQQQPLNGSYGFETADLSHIRVAVIFESASSKAYVAKMAGMGQSILKYDEWIHEHCPDFCIFRKEVIIFNLVCTQGGSNLPKDLRINPNRADMDRIHSQLSSLPNLELIMLCTAKAKCLLSHWNRLDIAYGQLATLKLKKRDIKIFWTYHPNGWQQSINQKNHTEGERLRAHQSLFNYATLQFRGLGECGQNQFFATGFARFSHFENLLPAEERARIHSYKYSNKTNKAKRNSLIQSRSSKSTPKHTNHFNMSSLIIQSPPQSSRSTDLASSNLFQAYDSPESVATVPLLYSTNQNQNISEVQTPEIGLPDSKPVEDSIYYSKNEFLYNWYQTMYPCNWPYLVWEKGIANYQFESFLLSNLDIPLEGCKLGTIGQVYVVRLYMQDPSDLEEILMNPQFPASSCKLVM